MTRQIGGLLRGNHDFRQLWLADAISQVGTRTSYLVLPLLAVQALHAGAVQTALIRTAQTGAALLIGLPAGAWCDRMRRRPVLLSADVGRGLLLASIPVAAALGALSLIQLYVVVFAAGILTVFFDTSHQSYLPRLVERDRLVEANAKLQTNLSVAATAAPTIGGLLVQAVSAPYAVLLDAMSYLASALGIARITDREPVPDRPVERSLVREVQAGLRFVLCHPIIRPVALFGATVILFQSGYMAISVVFLVRDVHLSAGMIGLLSSVALLGAVVGAATTRRLTNALGAARCMWLSGIVMGVGALLVPLTAGGAGLLWYVFGNAACSFAIIVGNIISASFTARLCPTELLGRMNASLKFLLFGMAPLGSLLGGALASSIGLRPTLWCTQAGIAASALWLVASPLVRSRELPVS